MARGSQSAGAMKLVDHFVSSNGVVIASYEPNGEVQTGGFGPDDPSARELKRRQAMKEGTW